MGRLQFHQVCQDIADRQEGTTLVSGNPSAALELFLAQSATLQEEHVEVRARCAQQLEELRTLNADILEQAAAFECA